MSTKETHLRRKDRMIDPTDTKKIMETCTYAVFSTADADGFPYGVPISPVVEEDHIYFHCANTGRKMENLAQNANACMTFVSFSDPDGEAFTTRYASAIAEGSAAFVTDEEEKRHALRLLCQRYTPHTAEAIDAYMEKYWKQTSVVRMEIHQLCGKANRKP